MTDAGELLRLYCEAQSQEAFANLVQRHLKLVYAAALRRVGGQRQLAEDVTQQVFFELSRRATSLVGHPMLIAWLYSYTRYAALRAMRSECRRKTRERVAAELDAGDRGTSTFQIERLRSVIDHAIDRLGSADRTAVLLRFFDQRTFAEIGRHLGLTEGGARLRVAHALESLRNVLRRHGVTSTATGLAAALAEDVSASSVPAGLAGTIVKVSAIPGGAGGTGIDGWSAFHLMATGKSAMVAVGIIGLCAIGWLVSAMRVAYSDHPVSGTLSTRDQPRSQVAALMPTSFNAPTRAAGALAGGGGGSVSQRIAVRAVPSLTGEGLVPASEWHDVGNQTPAAAFETFGYAREHTDTAAMVEAIGLNGEARAFITDYFNSLPSELRQQFGSAEVFAAAVWAQPHNNPPVAAMRVLGEVANGNDTMYLVTEWQYGNGAIEQKKIPFTWVDGGWRWVLNAGYLNQALQALADQPRPIAVAP